MSDFWDQVTELIRREIGRHSGGSPRIDVHLHLPEEAMTLLRSILHNIQELKAMSGTLSDELKAGLAEINTKVDAIATDVGTIQTEVVALISGMTPGDPVTQAMVDQVSAINLKLGDLKTAADGVVAQASGTTPVANQPAASSGP